MRRLTNKLKSIANALLQEKSEFAALGSAKNHKPEGSFDYLFFCPEASVIPHSTMMRFCALVLKESGKKVAGTNCWKLFSRCPSISAARLPARFSNEERKTICRSCLAEAVGSPDGYAIPKVWLPEFWDSECEQLLQNALRNFDEHPFGPVFHDIAFGKLTTLDLSLATKAYNYRELTMDQCLLWRQLVQTSITSYILTSRLHDAFKFSKFVYFNDYAPNLSGALAAKSKGCDIYPITQASNQNIDRRKIIIRNTFTVQYIPESLKTWPQWRSLALPKERISQIAEDSIVRWQGKGSHVYSPPPRGETSPYHGKPEKTKRIVAFTSSLDEIAAAFEQTEELTGKKQDYSLSFGSDISSFHAEWIKALFNWTSVRPDVELIVRIHPREGANKRESNRSAHLLRLERELPTPPNNCRVVWPEAKVSSYEIGEVADVVLTSWSTIGLEFARLGVPVLTASEGLSGFVNERFHRFVPGREKYFKTLDNLLSEGANSADITMAYRFWNFYILGSAIEIDDILSNPESVDQIRFSMPRRAKDIVKSLSGEGTALEINRALLESQQHKAGALEEKHAIAKASLKIAAHILGIDCPTDEIGVAMAGHNIESCWPSDSLRNCFNSQLKAPCIVVSGSFVAFDNGSGWNRRFSPLIARLLRATHELRLEPDSSANGVSA